ncbi:MAG: hypothetical protein VKK04_21850 [Synechococcales bacterium]|nr:hypothetical protein [Synechococcales bacterium]
MAPTASPPTATERIQRHIESIFPAVTAIPEAFRLPAPVHQREYLIRGFVRDRKSNFLSTDFIL